MIEIRDLEFAYDVADFRLGVPALDVAAGESVAFVGPSGCGKTTLVHLIAGILRPARGRIRVAGEVLGELSEREVRALRAATIGLVFQRFELLEYLSVADNIVLANLVSPALAPARQRREAAARLADRLGLGGRLRRHPEQLSQGERQRVAICRALLNEPAILIADEPTGNLDPDTTATIMALIWDQVRARRCTFLMVTHNRDLLARFDRVVDCRDLGRPV